MESDHIEIRNSKFGKGLFATKDIQAGTVLCKITGKELSFQQTVLLKERESHTLQIDFDRYILCEPPFLYSNHSCRPNCAINGNLEFFTLRKIKSGEELFWDYSTSMLERHWTMKCRCEEKNCRKIINDFDALPKHLQEKYLKMNIALPFIAHFIHYQRAKSA
jgi:SET domain-containing protein